MKLTELKSLIIPKKIKTPDALNKALNQTYKPLKLLFGMQIRPKIAITEDLFEKSSHNTLEIPANLYVKLKSKQKISANLGENSILIAPKTSFTNMNSNAHKIVAGHISNLTATTKKGKVASVKSATISEDSKLKLGQANRVITIQNASPTIKQADEVVTRGNSTPIINFAKEIETEGHSAPTIKNSKLVIIRENSKPIVTAETVTTWDSSTPTIKKAAEVKTGGHSIPTILDAQKVIAGGESTPNIINATEVTINSGSNPSIYTAKSVQKK